VKQYPSNQVDSGSYYPEVWRLRRRSEFLYPTQKIRPLDPTLQCTSTHWKLIFVRSVLILHCINSYVFKVLFSI